MGTGNQIREISSQSDFTETAGIGPGLVGKVSTMVNIPLEMDMGAARANELRLGVSGIWSNRQPLLPSSRFPAQVRE